MNLAGLRFDRTAALIDGRIRIDDVNVVNTPGGKAAIQGLLSGAFDAAEVPFARYVSWTHHGAKLRAAPIFTDRLFQHEYIYTRPDTGIESLADLKDETLRATFLQSNRRATAALTEYAAWLEKEKLPKATPEFAIGEEKYRRLAELKRTWDSENLFRRNQNILPA